MTDYGTIKIPRDEYEKHNEKRQAAGLTWAEYLNEEAARPGPDADIAEEVRELRREIRNGSEVGTDELAREVARQLDYAQVAGQVADEVEGRLR